MRTVIPQPMELFRPSCGAHGDQSRHGGQAMLPRNTVNDTLSREIGNPDLLIPLGSIKILPRKTGTGTTPDFLYY
jgi:hypothetical protein